MKIKISDHFTLTRLIKFVIPSIIMMIFTSIYGVVDGLFVSNLVGKTPFAAINLIMPFLMIFGAIGFMIGTGGSALVAKTLGEGKKEKANEIFSMLIITVLISGIVLSVAGILLLRNVASAFGAKGEMLEDCVKYGRIILMVLPAFMLQNVFQSFLVTAQKPMLGLIITLCAGFANIILDALFIYIFKWGLIGAAVATSASQLIGGIIPLIYFLLPNSSLLKLTKTKFDSRVLLKTCTNGSSEFMTNISLSLVNMLYNYQLMKLAGENGIAAYGVIMYVNFIFISVFLGYSIGSAPIIGYNYGAQNKEELSNIFRKSIMIISFFSILLTTTAELLATPLTKLFVGYDQDLFDLTRHGFMIFSLSFLILGFNIFSSAFFTALNNGIISATISFLRTLVFQILAVLILPLILGINGIWLAIIAAELLALVVSITFLVKMRKRYEY